MIRTNIHLTEPQRRGLAREAGKLGIGVAELVRRIIDEYLAQKARKP